ncbi:MAG TPA: hypothetical protein PLB35_00490 [Myxococcota bacterium]|nr:hypothetical protein [Myxococcota bacterium]HOH75712.1 hypothetical protein [Myxococcota bacterium]
MNHRLFVLSFLVAAISTVPVSAKVWGENEAPGDWSFKTDKPVRVIVIGGSVSEFNQGYSDWIGRTCRNVEVVNVAKARYGSWGIGKRFEAQVLANPNIDLKDPNRSYWVVLQGGLNNIWEPARVNNDFMELFRLIHSKGMKVVGLSLSPWGSDKDKRWVGIDAVRNQDRTRQCVDWMLGRLTPGEALGKYAAGKKSWDPADLPDVAIDLYDSPLRDVNARPRPAADIKARMARDKQLNRELSALPQQSRDARYQKIMKQAVEMPKWFLRPELQSFDHIHPNREGHRIIVETACPKLPAEWGCDCTYIRNAGKKAASR